MSYDLGLSLLTVLGVLAGIGALLYVMAVLDPTNVRAASAARPTAGPAAAQTPDPPGGPQRAAYASISAVIRVFTSAGANDASTAARARSATPASSRSRRSAATA